MSRGAAGTDHASGARRRSPGSGGGPRANPHEISLVTDAGTRVALRREDVLLVEGRGGRVTWTAVGGAFTQAGERYAGSVLRECGWGSSFVAVGAGRYVNPCRLRSVLWIRGEKRFRLLLEGGNLCAPLQVWMHYEKRASVARALGLARLEHVEPLPREHRIMWEEGLRDYETEIFLMTEEELRGFFGDDDGAIDVRRLIANIIWQQFCWRRAGVPLSSDTSTERGFWYRPVEAVLNRLGLVKRTAHGGICDATLPIELGLPGSLREGPPEHTPGSFLDTDTLLFGLDGRTPVGDQALYDFMLKVLADMTADHRLFTYRDLGFDDPRPDIRRIGTERPEIVVVVEKRNLFNVAVEAHERWGVSAICLGGNPTWLPTEYFCHELGKALPSGMPVRLVTVVDYDPFGWILAEMFANQLGRYGVAVSTMSHLVLPRRFTPEELRRLSYVVRSDNPAIRGKIAKWIRSGGGIDGEPRAIYADHLWPRERIVDALQQEIARPAPRRKSPRPAPETKGDKVAGGASASLVPCPAHECGGRLAVQGRKGVGLVFLPCGEVEVIREERGGRLEILSTGGGVFHLSKSIDALWRELSGRCPTLERAAPSEIRGIHMKAGNQRPRLA